MNKLGMGLLAACVTMAIAATPALAQQGGQGGGMMGKGGPDQGMMGAMMGKGGKAGCPKMGGMMGQGVMGKSMKHSRPMMEARLAYIKTDLEITDAQMAAWNAYADAVRARFTAMEDARKTMMKAMESGNAMGRMDARIKAAQAKLDSLKALKPATEALYNALTDLQKREADKLLGGGCGMM